MRGFDAAKLAIISITFINAKEQEIKYTIQSCLTVIIQKMCRAHVSRNTRGKPLLFHNISVLCYFTCITQHTGPAALRPIRRANQLWLSVLPKDTSAATGQAGIRTHILTTPELESNALDRSATTLPFSEYFKAISLLSQRYR